MSIMNKVATEYIKYFVNEYYEYIEDTSNDIVFNDDFLNGFIAYLENPNNQYRHLVYFNKSKKSYYVRFCNKYIKENYGYEYCIKYNIHNSKLLLHIIQTIASQNYEEICNMISFK